MMYAVVEHPPREQETPMDLSQARAACTDAIANTPRWQWRRPALELHSPQVLGIHGQFIPADPDDPSPRPVYGYSRGKCRKILDAIDAAALEDARALGLL